MNNVHYEIRFPQAQFENALPDYLIPAWKNAFHRDVTVALILHDRTRVAYTEGKPNRKAIVRVALCGMNLGASMRSNAKINDLIVRKKLPKKWDSLVSDEVNRIMDLTDPKSVVV